MKQFKLIIVIQILILNISFSQNSVFEKEVKFDTENIVGIGNKLVEITNDNLLLVAGSLNDFYLYDISKKKLIKSVELKVIIHKNKLLYAQARKMLF